MEAMTSLFTSKATASVGAEGADVVSSDDFGTNGALPSGDKTGSGGFGIDRLFSSSQNIPFVGPVVSVFQAFNDERDARRSAARLDFNAKQEELVGKTNTVRALRSLNDAQAANVANSFTGAGGLSGSRGRVAQDVNRDASLGLTLIRTNAEINAADLRQKAGIIRKVARFDRNVVVGKSLFRFVSSAASLA